jgi:hypothetical protein
MTDAGGVQVSVRHANDLTRALVANACSDPADRLLFIKGEPAVELGLRPGRGASDVDVLVGAATQPRLTEALEQHGWRRRPLDASDDVFPEHSVSFYHPHWPNDVDVHVRFPGFDADPETVIEALWAGRTAVSSASVDVPVPGLAGSALILALNCLRAPDDRRARAELDYLVDVAPKRVTGAELLDLAQRTGSLAAARPFFERAFPGVGPVQWPEPSPQWLTYTILRESAAIRLVALLGAPLRQWPRMLRRAVLPSRDALAAVDLAVLEDDSAHLRWRRWQRLRRAFASLPLVLRQVRDFRRAVKGHS